MPRKAPGKNEIYKPAPRTSEEPSKDLQTALIVSSSHSLSSEDLLSKAFPPHLWPVSNSPVSV